MCAGVRPERAAHYPDEVVRSPVARSAAPAPSTTAATDFCRDQAVWSGHEERTEAELQIRQPLGGGVLDGFGGHARAGGEIGQRPHRVVVAAQVVDERRHLSRHLDQTACRVDLAGAVEPMVLGELRDRLGPEGPFEVTMEIDERQTHGRCGRSSPDGRRRQHGGRGQRWVEHAPMASRGDRRDRLTLTELHRRL